MGKVSGGLGSFLLVIVAIVGGVVFLVALGAVALWSSLTLISAVLWVFGIPGRLRARRERRRQLRRES
jgi:membrane protein implicated in regulation of membrane protease activity